MTKQASGAKDQSSQLIDNFSISLQIVVPQVIEAAVLSLPDPSAWLQRVIIEAASRELLESGTLNLALQPHSLADESPQSSSHATNSQTEQGPAELPIGCVVRNPLRWLGKVKTYNAESGRYLVTFQNGIDRDFPRHLLTFVALTSADLPSPLDF